jgi:uncharacterized membrane protein YcfT
MELTTLLIIGLLVAILSGIGLLFFLVIGLFAVPILFTIAGYWLDWLYDSIEHFFTYWRGGDGGNSFL